MSIKPVSFEVKVYEKIRAFNVPKDVRIELGIQGGDSVHLAIRSQSGTNLFEGRKTLKSGNEIYGAHDVGSALEPGSTILVQASKPWRFGAEAEAASFSAQERGAGFQSNTEIQRLVEKYAMNLAEIKLALGD